MPNMYGVLIIGLGNIAMGYDLNNEDMTWTHIGAINKNSKFKLIAAIDPNIGTHNKLNEINSAKSYFNIDDFLKSDHEGIDMVVISSPTAHHLEHYRKIKALKPKLVLIEKPLVENKHDLASLMSEIDQDTNVMVNLFRLYQKNLNKVLSDLSGLGRCRINVRYSKTRIHNGIHFISLVIRHFGDLISQEKITLQGIETISLKFKFADVILQPAMHDLDDNSMIVQSIKGTLYYLSGGRISFFVDSKNTQHDLSGLEFKHYMLNVYDQCFEVMNGKKDDSLSLAYVGQKILMEYENNVA